MEDLKEENYPKQFCPICKTEVELSTRYPDYVCNDCFEKTKDSKGRSVSFYNPGFFGQGCEGRYNDDNSKYKGTTCFIDNIECVAKEAYFGGIVIQPR